MERGWSSSFAGPRENPSGGGPYILTQPGTGDRPSRSRLPAARRSACRRPRRCSRALYRAALAGRGPGSRRGPGGARRAGASRGRLAQARLDRHLRRRQGGGAEWRAGPSRCSRRVPDARRPAAGRTRPRGSRSPGTVAFASHPEPDASSVRAAARRALRFFGGFGEGDAIVCLDIGRRLVAASRCREAGRDARRPSGAPVPRARRSRARRSSRSTGCATSLSAVKGGGLGRATARAPGRRSCCRTCPATAAGRRRFGADGSRPPRRHRAGRRLQYATGSKAAARGGAAPRFLRVAVDDRPALRGVMARAAGERLAQARRRLSSGIGARRGRRDRRAGSAAAPRAGADAASSSRSAPRRCSTARGHRASRRGLGRRATGPRARRARSLDGGDACARAAPRGSIPSDALRAPRHARLLLEARRPLCDRSDGDERRRLGVRRAGSPRPGPVTGRQPI